ncbi:MAG TPA: DUF1800 domain-containing protein [Gemmatimonadaceae bacterium]|nr:DUF1800 domain-containing protein [Gemmatimonadaceae bacterium]
MTMRSGTLYTVVAALSYAVPIWVQAQGSTSRPATRSVASDVRELPADQQIIHALSRLTFGPRPDDALAVRAIGLDNWIAEQLHPERIDDSALESFVARYSAINRDQNDLLRAYAEQQRARREVQRQADGTMDGADSIAMRREMQQRYNLTQQVITQLQSSRVARAVASERQLQEVMTDFWHNHFSVFVRKGQAQPYYIADFDQKVIRPRALGKFRDLLGAVAQSPAMLFYLDNARSMADSGRPTLRADGRLTRMSDGRPPAMPRAGAAARRRAVRGQAMPQLPAQRRRGGLNENYGRELLELHTLGVDGGYTQQDVINVARAFTGWTIRQPQQGGGFVFRPQAHDAGEKIVLGHKLAAGRGMEDGEDVLDILARSPVTARFIATKIARRFVSDVPPEALVDRAAAVFLRTDGDIREVVRTIVTSPEFFSQQAFRSKVKSPFEVVVSAMRALNARPDSTPRTAQVIAYLGQPIFGHQAPNGWPETGEAWMNTGAILNRINFGMAVAAGRLPGISIRALPGLDTVRRAPRERQVDAVVATLLNGMVSPDTRAVLLSGDHPMLSAGAERAIPDVAAASAAAAAEPSPEPARSAQPAMSPRGRRPALRGRAIGNLPPLNGLPQIVGLALGSPEFQRR